MIDTTKARDACTEAIAKIDLTNESPALIALVRAVGELIQAIDAQNDYDAEHAEMME